MSDFSCDVRLLSDALDADFEKSLKNKNPLRHSGAVAGG